MAKREKIEKVRAWEDLSKRTVCTINNGFAYYLDSTRNFKKLLPNASLHLVERDLKKGSLGTRRPKDTSLQSERTVKTFHRIETGDFVTLGKKGVVRKARKGEHIIGRCKNGGNILARIRFHQRRRIMK